MKSYTTIDNKISLLWGLNLTQAYVFNWLMSIAYDGDTNVFYLSERKALDELKLITTKPDTIYRHLKTLRENELITFEKIKGSYRIELTTKTYSWTHIKSI